MMNCSNMFHDMLNLIVKCLNSMAWSGNSLGIIFTRLIKCITWVDMDACLRDHGVTNVILQWAMKIGLFVDLNSSYTLVLHGWWLLAYWCRFDWSCCALVKWCMHFFKYSYVLSKLLMKMNNWSYRKCRKIMRRKILLWENLMIDIEKKLLHAYYCWSNANIEWKID